MSMKFSAIVAALQVRSKVGFFLGFDPKYGIIFLSKNASKAVCSRFNANTEVVFCETEEWECRNECSGECHYSGHFEDYLATNKPFSSFTLTVKDIGAISSLVDENYTKRVFGCCKGECEGCDIEGDESTNTPTNTPTNWINKDIMSNTRLIRLLKQFF